MAHILRRGFLFLGASAGLASAGVLGRIAYLRVQDNPLPETENPKIVNVGGWALDENDIAQVN